MQLEWKDCSSYSQRGTGRGRGECEPSGWETEPAGLRIVVTRYHGVPGRWFLLCREMGIASHRELPSADLEAAKLEAIEFVVAALRLRINADQQSLAQLTPAQPSPSPMEPPAGLA